MSLRIHPAALDELEAATDWYAQRSKRAAERFLDELEHAVGQISQDPQIHASYVAGTRRVPLRRFPFLIVFREKDGDLEIIAIVHGKRRPGYWRERIG